MDYQRTSEYNFFEPWYQFHDPLVRQLAFAIASYNVLSDFPEGITVRHDIQFHPDQFWQDAYQRYQPELCQLDQNPQPLYQFLQQVKSTRLGLRFEALLWYWLNDSKNQNYQLLGHSIQQHHAGKTLGEIDFLVRNCATDQVEHWEVALKYYLADDSNHQQKFAISDWVGLNRNDTFEHKLRHFSQKQFQFDQALGHPIQQRFAVMKGQLFLPNTARHPSNAQDHTPNHNSLPNWLNTTRRLGMWQANAPQDQHWRRLKRSEWLSPEYLSEAQIRQQQKNAFWTNGLYFDETQLQYLMIRLNSPTMVYTKLRNNG